MVLRSPSRCAHWPGLVSFCIWSHPGLYSSALLWPNPCHMYLFLSDIRWVLIRCFISCMDSCLWTQSLPTAESSETRPAHPPYSPLNASHSAISWSPVRPQIRTLLGTCTNSSLCLSSWVDMPSAKSCKVVMPLNLTPFFDSQTLLYLAIYLRTWGLTLSQFDLFHCSHRPETVSRTRATGHRTQHYEKAYPDVSYKLVKDVYFHLGSELFTTLAENRWHIKNG